MAAGGVARRPLMVLDRVSKIYGSGEIAVHALRGIDFRVERGDFVAIMGSSGSGKSTLMHIIGCLDVPSAGAYRLAGEDVSAMDDVELAEVRNRQIGFVFQQFNLLPAMNALRNVEVPLSYGGVPRDVRRARARNALARVGLDDRVLHRPSELSGGQQQRVAIARALALDPKVMLFDEPTSALDPELVGEVLAVMRRVAESGMTMVIVTHELSFAREIGDFNVFMDEGLIAESGPRGFLDNCTNPRTKQFMAAVL
jgi:putative ABC transport system ATP-binding protein